jgi:hypothetical protein
MSATLNVATKLHAKKQIPDATIHRTDMPWHVPTFCGLDMNVSFLLKIERPLTKKGLFFKRIGDKFNSKEIRRGGV